MGPVLYSVDTTNDWRSYLSNSFIDSLDIGNTRFYNVQECRTYGKPVNDSNFYYTVEHVGLIRKVLQENIIPETWDLIKWNIIK